MKHLHRVGWLLFALWAASTAWELYARGPGEPISILGQLLFSVGLPYFVLFMILRWFLRESGLERLPLVLEKLERQMEERNNRKEG